MKVLLDHKVPAQLRLLLKGHLVMTARAMKWTSYENGELIAAAQSAGFDVMITGDRNLTYQQNSANRTIALIVIRETKRRVVLPNFEIIGQALSRACPGSYKLVEIPAERKGVRAVD